MIYLLSLSFNEDISNLAKHCIIYITTMNIRPRLWLNWVPILFPFNRNCNIFGTCTRLPYQQHLFYIHLFIDVFSHWFMTRYNQTWITIDLILWRDNPQRNQPISDVIATWNNVADVSSVIFRVSCQFVYITCHVPLPTAVPSDISEEDRIISLS